MSILQKSHIIILILIHFLLQLREYQLSKQQIKGRRESIDSESDQQIPNQDQILVILLFVDKINIKNII